MRFAVLLVLVAAASCERSDCPQPSPAPLSDGGVGDPCLFDSHCVSTLLCRRVLEGPYPAESFGTGACTQSCSDQVACAAGVCAALTLADGGTLRTCLRGCTDDAECAGQLGFSRCVAGVCERAQCTADDQCPASHFCEVSGVVCCPTGQQCGFTGVIPGYCRRR